MSKLLYSSAPVTLTFAAPLLCPEAHAGQQDADAPQLHVSKSRPVRSEPASRQRTG
jgi:hypothetical protein